MSSAQTQWFPAVGEPSVLGRFGYTDIIDIPASKLADEERYKPIVVLFTKGVGEIDTPGPIKVLPSNQKEMMLRFPEAWRAFEGEDVTLGGTPLDALKLSADKVVELRIFGVTRMEHLAAISDQQCENMGFGTKSLRNRAREILGLPNQFSAGPSASAMIVPAVAAPTMSQAEINQAIADGVAKAMAALKAQEPPPKRRGRPPRAKPAEQATEAA